MIDLNQISTQSLHRSPKTTCSVKWCCLFLIGLILTIQILFATVEIHSWRTAVTGRSSSAGQGWINNHTFWENSDKSYGDEIGKTVLQTLHFIYERLFLKTFLNPRKTLSGHQI